MKLLVVGNSQAGAIKRAHDARAAEIRAAGLHLHFYVIPGGMGPDLRVEDDRLVLNAVNAAAPPYMLPAGTDKIRLSSFDAVIFSALGFFDGGFAFVNPISRCGVMSEFQPRGIGLERMPVSDTCLREMMRALFERQPGIRALRAICAAYDGPVLVQRFPQISEEMLERPDWYLRHLYTAPLAAHHFLGTLRDDIMAAIASETGAELLDYPDFGHPSKLTPRSYMRASDGVHQDDSYGDLILGHILRRLGQAAAPGVSALSSGS